MSDATLPALVPRASSASTVADGRGTAKVSTDSGAHFDRMMQSKAVGEDASAKVDGGEAKAAATTTEPDDRRPATDVAGVAAAPADPQTLAGLIQVLLAAAVTPATGDGKAGGDAPTPSGAAATLAAAPPAVALPSSTAVAATTEGATPSDLAALLAGPHAGGVISSPPAYDGGVPTEMPASISAAMSALLSAAGVEAAARAVGTAAAVVAVPVVRDPATPAVQTSSAVPTPPPALPSSTLDAAELPQRLGERLRWLIDGGVQEARLRLHPQELGTIDIRVRVDAGTARVWFAAEHPAARAALETALPQLRERFAGDGLALQSSSVSMQDRGRDSQGRPRQPAFAPLDRPFMADQDGADVAASAASRAGYIHDGAIDRYV